jgi:hypothetical protein
MQFGPPPLPAGGAGRFVESPHWFAGELVDNDTNPGRRLGTEVVATTVEQTVTDPV